MQRRHFIDDILMHACVEKPAALCAQHAETHKHNAKDPTCSLTSLAHMQAADHGKDHLRYKLNGELWADYKVGC